MMHQALNAQALYYDIVGNKVIIRACIMYSEMKGWAAVVNRGGRAIHRMRGGGSYSQP